MDTLAPSTVNDRLTAARKLVKEARRNGLLSAEAAGNLAEISNVRQQETRLGNWLTKERARELLAVPDRSTLKGKRDYGILASWSRAPWMIAAGIEEGRLLRRVLKNGKVVGESLSVWAVWSVVTESAQQIGIERFGAHDLLSRKAGGDLEQMKFLLGHSSIQTTERYLGSEP